ncbi:hypothetical protein [Paenibacillus sp.]|uniref:hypothetical protein n=1 Tax=Paenibacillus sp. TaxID=58172 RepID=UPI002D35DDEA|nr:hypothetical protein [Paenibacillus sp.]HZG58229.1 hypothetical protein [Paenibacillus sp.]
MRIRLSIWPAVVTAAAAVLLHAVHAGLLLAAAGAAGVAAHAHHAHHGHGGAYVWLAWLGWGVNALSLALCAALFVSYVRRRRDEPRAARAALSTCLATFAVVAATSVWALT